MTFGESISTCFSKYATFEGRASRSEFWWFCLFAFLCNLVASIFLGVLGNIVILALLVPSIAVACRRLHDTNRSGWLQLLGLIPILGFIVLIYFYVQEAKEPNRYDAVPA